MDMPRDFVFQDTAPLLHFIESHAFSRQWKELDLDVNALFDLQTLIANSPDQNPVISGTGGLRKIRFAPDKWHTGKRGALRICYVYFEEHHIIWLGFVYAKSVKNDLSASDKKGISEAITRIEHALSKGKYN